MPEDNVGPLIVADGRLVQVFQRYNLNQSSRRHSSLGCWWTSFGVGQVGVRARIHPHLTPIMKFSA